MRAKCAALSRWFSASDSNGGLTVSQKNAMMISSTASANVVVIAASRRNTDWSMCAARRSFTHRLR